MKNIIIINQYVSMPGEKSNGRFRYLADLLANKENNVELITTNFSHRDKKHRSLDENRKNTFQYKFTMLPEPGYKKNISLKRFYSHYIFSKNLRKYLSKIQKPDVIYCAVPSLDVAKEAVTYAKKNNIRFILDIQDLWPEAFKMIFKIPLLKDILFYPMKKEANYIYKNANDIVAVSNTYVNRATSVNTRYKNKLTVFLGTDLEYFDKCQEENKIHYNDGKIRIAYIGTLGHSYDLITVIEAISLLQRKGINNIKFVIMGDGPLKDKFQKYANEKDIDCDFTGRLDYPKMVGNLCSCDIAVNPIIKGSAGSIINKVGDYAAAGLPIINTQESKEYRDLVEKYKIGFNCNNKDFIDVAEKIEILIKDNSKIKKMGLNNRKLAEEKFDRKKTYGYIRNLILDEDK